MGRTSQSILRLLITSWVLFIYPMGGTSSTHPPTRPAPKSGALALGLGIHNCSVLRPEKHMNGRLPPPSAPPPPPQGNQPPGFEPATSPPCWTNYPPCGFGQRLVPHLRSRRLGMVPNLVCAQPGAVRPWRRPAGVRGRRTSPSPAGQCRPGPAVRPGPGSSPSPSSCQARETCVGRRRLKIGLKKQDFSQ